MQKTFCISGPIIPEDHYFIPLRIDYRMLTSLVAQKLYFVLHAPRQSGKTTEMDTFAELLNHEGKFSALYINVEAAQAARDSVKDALITIVNIIAREFDRQLPEYRAISQHLRQMASVEPVSFDLLTSALAYCSEHIKKPLVLFIDEIDSLIGDSLLSVLRQVRAGFKDRPTGFPQSICLIGLRDVRDYRIWSQEQGVYVSTSSPFNIKAESLTLANFTLDQVSALYTQHTLASGQKFTEEACRLAFHLTQGQPWLVNALAYEACFRNVCDRTQEITAAIIEKAKNQLILRQDTHIDSLLDKLNEKRVLGIIDAIISGKSEISTFNSDDVQYVYDLGLIKKDGFEIANPIYQEIIPRALTSILQKMVPDKGPWYVDEKGDLDMHKLLNKFTEFYREHSGVWSGKIAYHESMPHLLLMAFLQRIINGSGTVQREYALGRKRVDLYVTWKKQKFVIELKIKHKEDTLQEGLIQTRQYMDISGVQEGHLLLFDRNSQKSWDEKISFESILFNGKPIHVWMM
jgi:hypothetical protein